MASALGLIGLGNLGKEFGKFSVDPAKFGAGAFLPLFCRISAAFLAYSRDGRAGPCFGHNGGPGPRKTFVL